VRAVGDSHYRRQFSASERARGAQQRSTSRSPGEETATPRDPELRSHECVFGSGISCGAQPAFCTRSGSTGELSRSGTERSEAERGLPVRDGTMDQQRLGGAVPGAFSTTQTAE